MEIKDCPPPGEVTYVKTYVNMRVRRILKWTHISEVHGCRFTPFSEPLHHKHTLISEVHPQILNPFCEHTDLYSIRYPYPRAVKEGMIYS